MRAAFLNSATGTAASGSKTIISLYKNHSPPWHKAQRIKGGGVEGWLGWLGWAGLAGLAGEV